MTTATNTFRVDHIETVRTKRTAEKRAAEYAGLAWADAYGDPTQAPTVGQEFVGRTWTGQGYASVLLRYDATPAPCGGWSIDVTRSVIA